MKSFACWTAIAGVALAGAALAADKTFPGQAGNDNVELTASVMLDPAQIREAVGADLEKGIVVVKAKVTNKTGDPLRVSPDDFTLLSRKNGDRADALAPGQLAGGSVLVVKRDHSGRDWAQQTNQPGFIGIAGVSKGDHPKDDKLLATLKSKELPDAELKSNASGEGLLYFSIDGSKLKPKDLALIYKGAGGHLSMDFK
jgi:hypothetical protein